MATPHINANKGDFSKVVLMPGDPLRAKWIADTYLSDVKVVNEVRGNYAYTGMTKNGKRISVMASGMGMPSIGIYSHELYTEFGVETIIRVGTCGAYQQNINLFDVLVCTTASTDSNYAYQYEVPQYSAGCDFQLAVEATKILEEKKIPYHAGNILSADVFYDTDPEYYKKWVKLGVLGVEMESYALYVNAATLKKRALTLLTVTDHFVNKGEKASTEERQLGLGKMIDAAITLAEKYA
ncbi:MAG: purine-nucleoside phosphorylase [Coprobacillus sp.]|nr:purine-nucleoside phosphorylase [Coprobacillus sp.]